MKFSQIIYTRYDVENLINAYQKATKIILNATSVDEILLERNNVVACITALDTAYNLAYIRWSQNTADKFYCAEKRYYEENMPLISDAETGYIKALLNSPFINLLKENIPPILFEIYNYKLIANNPIISKDIIEENLTSSEYSDFMSALTINFLGEEIPFTLLKKYMQSENRSMRELAYVSLGCRLEKDANFLDSNFDKLVKIRTNMAKKLGYNNFSKLGYYRMNRIGYTLKDIDKFRKLVVKYIVPLVNRIKRKIYDKMQIFEPKLYDYNVVINDKVVPDYMGEELFKKALNVYSKMGASTKEFFTSMLDNEAFDYISRVNKWGGGYQTDLKDYNMPFILANFNGTTADVDVLTHEGGHAYASYLAFKNNVDKELGLSFMDVAETHSMSMEFLFYKFISEFFNKNATKYKLMHFADSLTFIPYGVMVDDFQNEVYKNYSLLPNERNDLWNKLEEKYRPYMNSKGLPYFNKGTRWQYQMHIYESPFYYIDYALAQVVALQFLFLSLEDYDLAFKKYNEFVSYGASMPFTDIIKKCGLKSPFEEDTIKEISLKGSKYFDELWSLIN